ncbi:hypothetical protein Moror_13206 [Moniliophthora roreri MCA 2997]|uniref:Protein kinase domain-containing protein n=2 Tax=Moniliophthora roreri TaxID=221103 RepID=V2YB47_MONRO|nr:hypothetical protein Moror_13206 [Moniliophthora roreri MCA 2997]KAI3603279.1 hypothetical protein WG66_002256 [Moniliophthora roreri]
MDLSCVVFIGNPTPENIHYIEIRVTCLKVNPTDTLRDIQDKIFAKYPEFYRDQVKFYKPKTLSTLNETLARRVLKGQTLARYAEQRFLHDRIHEVFGVADDVLLLTGSLIICIENIVSKMEQDFQNYVKAVRAANLKQDDTEAQDVVELWEQDFQKHIKAILAGEKPSVAAEPINYNENQASDATLLDGRFNVSGNETVAPPIELYHPVFASFLSYARDKNLEVPEEVLCDTAELIRQCSAIDASESPDAGYRQTLANILRTPVDIQVVHQDGTFSGCTSPLPTPMNVSAAPYIVDFESHLGSSGFDPTVQLSFSYARFYSQKNRAPIRNISCCPSFLISLASPWIAILGAVMTSRTIVQRLSSYEWLACSRVLDYDQVFNIGRLLYALRLAIAELKEYYSTLAAPTVLPGHIAPRFCPSITSFIDSNEQTVNFSYVTPLLHYPMCGIFLVKLVDGEGAGTFAVVKFIRRYGAAAHTWMAERGFAPRLIQHTSLGSKYGSLALVVMEYIDGETLDDLYPAGVPDEVRHVIRRALDVLGEGGFIYGDLQKQNIMLARSNGDESVEKRLRFIDFDWACREGDGVRYPFHLSRLVRELSGADDYEIIERKHQESMFEKLR